MTLSIKHLALLVVLAAMVSAAMTYTVTSLTAPATADAGHAHAPKAEASSAAVVRELRAIKKAIGTSPYSPGLRKTTFEVAKQANNMCRMMTEYPATNCGSVSP